VYDEIVAAERCHDRWAGYLHDQWRGDPDAVHTVLDLCCGTGLMSAALARLGYRPTGVDSSGPMLARARRRVGPGPALHQQTLPDLTVGGVFDAAVCTFDAFNYLTIADFGRTLKAVSLQIRPGGWLAFDLLTDAMLAFAAAHPVATGAAEGKTYAISAAVDLTARECVTRIEVTGPGDADSFTEQHRQFFFRDADVRDALADADFLSPSVTDDYTDNPPTPSTLHTTWISRRPAMKFSPNAHPTIAKSMRESDRSA
jgi:SAM-dependent methyltransferase